LIRNTFFGAVRVPSKQSFYAEQIIIPWWKNEPTENPVEEE
jgi:hypothetical protein